MRGNQISGVDPERACSGTISRAVGHRFGRTANPVPPSTEVGGRPWVHGLALVTFMVYKTKRCAPPPPPIGWKGGKAKRGTTTGGGYVLSPSGGENPSPLRDFRHPKRSRSRPKPSPRMPPIQVISQEGF